LTQAERSKTLEEFIEIQCILADALYGTGKFLDRASSLFDGAQVISQLRENQNLRLKKSKVMDIAQAYTLRWLVEVVLQDWKSNEGWDAMTKQPGPEGSSQSLILREAG